MSHANITKFHYNTLYKLLAACLKRHEITTDYVPLHLSTLQFKMVKIQNVKISTCFRLLYIKSSLTKTLQVVTPIEYSSLQFIRKTTWFFTAKDAWSFSKHCHFKRSIALWLFPLCFIQIDNISKRHLLTRHVYYSAMYPTVLPKKCTNTFYCKKKIGISCSFAFLKVI